MKREKIKVYIYTRVSTTITAEELWHDAQVKLLAQTEKYEHVNRSGKAHRR